MGFSVTVVADDGALSVAVSIVVVVVVGAGAGVVGGVKPGLNDDAIAGGSDGVEQTTLST